MNKLVVKYRILSEKVLNFCAEQEVRAINIKKKHIRYFITRNEELFSPVKSMVLDGEENETPATLIWSSYPKLLLNQKEKGLNFESEFN